MFSRLKDLIFDFAPAVLGALLERLDAEQKPLTVGWFLLTKDLHSASSRYRCFHFARVFENLGVKNTYFTEAGALCAQIKHLDAVVIVKRLDASVIDVVAEAKASNKVVFLDLCDDLLAIRYSKNRAGANRLVFAGIVSDLDGLVVPSAGMATRVQDYCRHIGHPQTPIHIVPDIAESEELFWKTASLLNGETVGMSARLDNKKTTRSVVWFGNFGAAHSNFGIGSLLLAIPSLRVVHNDIPLELVVVSNNQDVYRSLIAPCGVPTRYVPWSPERLYEELRAADVALLTTGDDEFSAVKSSNRILLALAMDVPVVASSTSSFPELVDCVVMNNFERGLRMYLGPERRHWVAKAMAAAQSVLKRYQPEQLANVWLKLLERRIKEKKDNGIGSGVFARRVVIVLDSAFENERLGNFFSSCKKAGYEFQVVTSVEACLRRPKLRDTLADHRVAPVVIPSLDKLSDALLYGSSSLVLEDKPGGLGTRLRMRAKEQALDVISITEFQQRLTDIKQYEKSKEDSDFQFQPGPNPEAVDPTVSPTWLFVVHENNKGWILDAICREIGSRQSGTWRVVYNPPTLPPAQNYFFSHYSLYLRHFWKNPAALANSGTFVWYTHPPHSGRFENAGKIAKAFNSASQVIFTCSANRELWSERGLVHEKGCVVLGGADPNLFRPHKRGSGVVGLSSSFYERKNPDCLLEIVRLMPHRRFRLIGRNWEQYALFENLKMLPNFSYVTIPYNNYPAEYENFDVFLSVSSLEGGPIPLLEAMMGNIVPVASRTGFAPDLIRHRENGFLFDVDAPAEVITPLIDEAFELQADIRATVLDYSWDNFSQRIASLGK